MYQSIFFHTDNLMLLNYHSPHDGLEENQDGKEEIEIPEQATGLLVRSMQDERVRPLLI